MKKLFLGGLVAACGVFMTSCLEGGNNQFSDYAYGVIEDGMTIKLINIGDESIKFYSSSIASDLSIMNGDCCLFQYTLDYDIPENADITNKGYYTVTSSYYEKINNPYVSSVLTDTTVIDPNELAITKIESLSSGYIWPIIKGNMFLPTYHEGILKNQKQEFNLSFDSAQEPETINGDKVYNLFLRVIRTAEGESPSGNGAIVNAYNMNSFLNTIGRKVQSEGEKKVKFRIHYISKIDEKKEVAEWSISDIATYTFPEEK